MQGQSRRQAAPVLQRAGHSIRCQQVAICTAFSAGIKLVIAFAEQICARGPAEGTPYLQNASPGANNVGSCVIPVQIQTQQTRSSPNWYGSFERACTFNATLAPVDTFSAFRNPACGDNLFCTGARVSVNRNDVSLYQIKSSYTAELKLKRGSALHSTGRVPLLQTVQGCITGYWCLSKGCQIRSRCRGYS